jgi:hypothetical protein
LTVGGSYGTINLVLLSRVICQVLAVIPIITASLLAGRLIVAENKFTSSIQE